MNLSEKDIYKLHQKYSCGKNREKMLEVVWTHSQIIKEISLMIAQNLEKNYQIETNKNLLIFGSLVHDIGYYDCFDGYYKKIQPYILHGKIGYDILKKEKYPENVCRFTLIHLGVGINSEQIIKENIPLEKKDYIPITLEEEIVAYADNFHSKNPVCFNDYEQEKKEIEGFDQNSGIIFDRFRRKFGVPDLKKLEKKYKKWHEKIR